MASSAAEPTPAFLSTVQTASAVGSEAKSLAALWTSERTQSSLSWACARTNVVASFLYCTTAQKSERPHANRTRPPNETRSLVRSDRAVRISRTGMRCRSDRCESRGRMVLRCQTAS